MEIIQVTKNRRLIEVDKRSSETIIAAICQFIGLDKEFYVKDVVLLLSYKKRNTISHNLRQLAQRNFLKSHLINPRKRVYLMPTKNVDGGSSKAFLLWEKIRGPKSSPPLDFHI